MNSITKLLPQVRTDRLPNILDTMVATQMNVRDAREEIVEGMDYIAATEKFLDTWSKNAETSDAQVLVRKVPTILKMLNNATRHMKGAYTRSLNCEKKMSVATQMNGLTEEESYLQTRYLKSIDSGFLDTSDTSYANFSAPPVTASSRVPRKAEFPCGSIDEKLDPESSGVDHVKLVPYMENFMDDSYWNEETTERVPNPNARTSAYTDWPYRHVEKEDNTAHKNRSYNYHVCGNLYSG
jgi:hypothetical protein